MRVKDQQFEVRLLSSLSKVFADEPLTDEPYNKATALQNEVFSFQLAYFSDTLIKDIQLNINSELKDVITLRSVGLVPSQLPYRDRYDEFTLRTTPGLYPDPLYPMDQKGIMALPGQWRSLWVTVSLNASIKPGVHSIEIELEHETKKLGAVTFQLDVIARALPEQKLIHTEWFHVDCLATQYGVEVFSEEHWRLIDTYLQNFVQHGMNMILTPIFTPPLDTKVGGERPTVQLVSVSRTDGEYSFDFSLLERWVKLCQSKGIMYFEFSHLFTQWGAEHCPKIMADADGQYQRIFGWESESTGEEYRAFLNQFLPELIRFIQEHNLEKKSYFHISDEPQSEHLAKFAEVKAMVEQYLSDFPVIDALSDFEFYEQGVVKQPIPALDHIGPFIEHHVDPLWTYYCVAQSQKVSNRFFMMPSLRNRIIGLQFYKFHIQGFLHWGYNFWYSEFSTQAVNPFVQTDALCSFPSGDAFLVYPGEEGPIESIRMEVFYEALQDLRALQLLEQLAGRTSVLQLLDKGLNESLTVETYPHSMRWLLQLRETINEEIRKYV
ncbi:DUF4091 domain-containing protein [Sporolactobacillus laevolacticus]|uniref:DUF4091 domain-containing protein n=1 Tax=Sporolactobacillus laevolacticus TaxID=33018 RepID=UPI0025B591F1|nr:DUF4091 domain-containing protein [Sporolactobacillus laevolacticus]MDN3954858.1 DUF4091 domain-containing protein [Sporolactobacillus laevolacticus]